jgi:hypothetical protein
MSDGEAPPFAVRLCMGVGFAAVGLMPVLSALDVAPFSASNINGPPWLGLVIGAVFLSGAMFLLVYDASVRFPWIGSALAIALLVGFAVIGNWIAFGVGRRECSGDSFVRWFTDSRAAAEIECRFAFGMGALMLDGMLVWVLGVGLRQMGMPGPLPNWIEKLGKGLLLLSLAPVVIVLVVMVIGKALVEACATRWRTGAWPAKASASK